MTPDRRELLAHARRMAEKGAPGAAAALAALEGEDAIGTLRTTPMTLGRTRRRRIPSETTAHPDHAPTCDLNSGDSFDVSRGCSCRSRTTALELTLPWSCLVSDNEKNVALGGKKMLTTEYRAAKKKAIEEIRTQMAGRSPIDRPAVLIASVFEPNRTHRRDIANYGKLTHDALQEGGAITNDNLFDRITWIRAGVDVDRPRVEFTLHTL